MQDVKNKSEFDTFKTRFITALKTNSSVFIAFAIVFILASSISPKFLTFTNQMIVLRMISATTLTAFGMSFVVLTGGIDLSVGSYMSLAGCLTTILISWYEFNTIIAIFLAVCVGLVFGALNGLIITKMHMPPFIVTLATMNIMRGISYTITGGKPVSIKSDPLFERVGAGFIGKVPIAVVYIIVVFCVLWMLLNRSRFGRHVYAVGGNIKAASYSGINTNRIIFYSYILTGILAAFGGVILVSRLNSGQPTIGEGAELDAIAACIVGGMSLSGGVGTLTGTFIGAILMGVISNMLNLVGVNSFVQLIIKGIIIVFSVYINTLRSYATRTRKIDN
ncbi:MAG: ABC transporter permease [Christensenellales bacterium]|jgi:ribose transport system permease protein